MAYSDDGTRYNTCACIFVAKNSVDGALIFTLQSLSYFFLLSWTNCRFFSCGTNKDGESHIVEWDENEGVAKRSYVGLGKRAMGVVQFDTTKNRFLAAGDEFLIKFWDTEDVNLLTTTDANGGLPVIIELDFLN